MSGDGVLMAVGRNIEDVAETAHFTLPVDIFATSKLTSTS